MNMGITGCRCVNDHDRLLYCEKFVCFQLFTKIAIPIYSNRRIDIHHICVVYDALCPKMEILKEKR